MKPVATFYHNFGIKSTMQHLLTHYSSVSSVHVHDFYALSNFSIPHTVPKDASETTQLKVDVFL